MLQMGVIVEQRFYPFYHFPKLLGQLLPQLQVGIVLYYYCMVLYWYCINYALYIAPSGLEVRAILHKTVEPSTQDPSLMSRGMKEF